ncbi:PH domain-containing protein [Anoxybacteroides rupiense]|uniref:PH domain-containing protein n=1 Tax=Anoxybacteroides rupiense TaxID=311460 RepID=UPI0028ABBADB|nr:PH domain-containing protein [Anoxybacillus rupiensis]
MKKLKRSPSLKIPLSAPALSLDRLQITYGKSGKSKFILISPKDKSLFLKQIKKIRPDVLIEG